MAQQCRPVLQRCPAQLVSAPKGLPARLAAPCKPSQDAPLSRPCLAAGLLRPLRANRIRCLAARVVPSDLSRSCSWRTTSASAAASAIKLVGRLWPILVPRRWPGGQNALHGTASATLCLCYAVHANLGQHALPPWLARCSSAGGCPAARCSHCHPRARSRNQLSSRSRASHSGQGPCQPARRGAQPAQPAPSRLSRCQTSLGSPPSQSSSR